jgi:hypothetical protein
MDYPFLGGDARVNALCERSISRRMYPPIEAMVLR